MTSQDNLLARVETLERQNRRMKLIGLGSLILAGAFLLMGQAKQAAVLSEVKARSFVLVDSNGRERARLEMLNSKPMLRFLDLQGVEAAVFNGSGFGVFSNGANISLTVSERGPEVVLLNGKAKNSLILSTLADDGPSVTLDDGNGFETAIGVTSLITPTTGETSKTSAASIKLFGEDRTILWSAP